MAKRQRTSGGHVPNSTDRPLVVSYADGEVEQWPLTLLQAAELLHEERGDSDDDEEPKGTLDCSHLNDLDDTSDNDCHALGNMEDNPHELDVANPGESDKNSMRIGCGDNKSKRSCLVLRPRLPQPSYLFGGLKGSPVWPLETFPEVVSHLEKNFPVLREEVLQLLPASVVFDKRTGTVVSVASKKNSGAGDNNNNNNWEHQGEGLHSGIWQKLPLYSGGKAVRAGCVAAPRLFACLQSLLSCARDRGFTRSPMLEEAPGRAYLSLMLPNTRVRVHCGPTNHRLRLHLPLLVPKHASLQEKKSVLGMRLWHESHQQGKLHSTTLRWEEGKCLIIDDSFPHEVWYRPLRQAQQRGGGGGLEEPHEAVPLEQIARVVLVLDLWHPQCKFGPSCSKDN